MEPAGPESAWQFCDRILVKVSRSFALIIPRCPPPIDRCLCAGYLLCRLADTIEDDARLTPAGREALYDGLLACVAEPHSAEPCRRFLDTWPHQPEGGYGELVGGTEFVLQAFASCPPTHRGPLAACVREMVAGMRQMRPVAYHDGLEFYCRDLADLDRYCHYVAGTVGIMSTQLFELHMGDRFTATQAWREQGRRMGLGLQMTNIIKDACADARRGVSFVPPDWVESIEASPLLTHAGRARLIGHALAHLDAAVAYTLAVPPDQSGIRAFLLGSILPAVATLEVAAGSVQELPKIDRAAMQSILSFIDTQPADEYIRAHYQQHRAACIRGLQQKPT